MSKKVVGKFSCIALASDSQKKLTKIIVRTTKHVTGGCYTVLAWRPWRRAKT